MPFGDTFLPSGCTGEMMSELTGMQISPASEETESDPRNPNRIGAAGSVGGHSARFLQQKLSECEGCDTIVIQEHSNIRLNVRGPCTVTINRD